MAGIRIENSIGISIGRVEVDGGDVGVEAVNSDFSIGSAEFKNVGQAWDVDNSRATIGASKVSATRKERAIRTNVSKGWMPSKAPPLPILCGTCGNISPSTHHKFQGLFFEIWNAEEPCPHCGNAAKLSEGVFNLAGEVVEIIRAPQATHDLIAEFLDIGQRFRSGDLNEEQALSEISKVAPAAGKTIRQCINAGALLGAALIGFFGIVNGYHDFVENYQIDPLSISKDFILDHIMSSIWSSDLHEGLKNQPHSNLHAEGATPSKIEAVP